MIKVVEAVTDLYGTCIHMLWREPDWRMSVDSCGHALAKRTSDTAQLRADTRTQITVRSWRPGSASARVDNSAWARHQCCCLTTFRQQEICFRKQASSTGSSLFFLADSQCDQHIAAESIIHLVAAAPRFRWQPD